MPDHVWIKEKTMSALQNFVDQENKMSKIFGQRQLSLSIAADRQEIASRIDSQLSPEWLTCDGELSRTEVNRRYRALTQAAEQLLKVDPEVKFYEFS
jgi:hypothetical protein